MGEKLNDKRTLAEKKDSLLEQIRYNTAFSIAYEIQHLTQPPEVTRKDNNRQRLLRYIFLRCIVLIILKALLWDSAIKHDLGSLLAVLSGIADGILFSVFSIIFPLLN